MARAESKSVRHPGFIQLVTNTGLRNALLITPERLHAAIARLRWREMNNCSAELAGLGGCQVPISWVVKGSDKKMYSCGRHLNMVCLQMVTLGLEYMTVGITE